MTAVIEAKVPSYTPDLFHALSKVSRGRIGATTEEGVLHQQHEELPSGVFAALLKLRREGFVTVATTAVATPAWYPAVLTMRGTQLLAQWRIAAASRQPVRV